jgi:hypothetical protein
MPAFGKQRWYSEQSAVGQPPTELEQQQNSTGPAALLQEQQQQRKVSSASSSAGLVAHPHSKVCSWLQKYFAKRANATRTAEQKLAAKSPDSSQQPGPDSAQDLSQSPPEDTSQGRKVSLGGARGVHSRAAWPAPSWPWRWLWRNGRGPTAVAPAPEAELPAKRTFLVVAPIGSAFDSSK